MNLQTVEQALVAALKSRDQIAADTLRALKTRIQNEKIASGGELSESAVLALVQSEVKRRKEAATAYRSGGRIEAADKEEAEINVLMSFLPAQATEQDIIKAVDEQVAANGWTTKDFGQAMGMLKSHFGSSVDGAVLAKILKEKLQ